MYLRIENGDLGIFSVVAFKKIATVNIADRVCDEERSEDL